MRYDFDLLAREILPFTREEIEEHRRERQRQREEKRDDNNERTQTGNLRIFSAEQLAWDRLEDLRTLAKLRNQEDGIYEGMRDKFLFCASSFLAWVEPVRWYDEIRILAKEFTPTLSDAEVRSYTSSVYRRVTQALKGERISYQNSMRDARYRFTNQTLIDMLKISPDEERSLKTIISKAEARERHRIRNRQEMDRETYIQRANERKAQVLILAGEGRSIADIAKELCLNPKTIKGYLHG